MLAKSFKTALKNAKATVKKNNAAYLTILTHANAKFYAKQLVLYVNNQNVKNLSKLLT